MEKKKFVKPKGSLSIKHNLNELIKREQKYLSIKENRKVLIKEVHQIIASECNISEGALKAMKKDGYYIPSLEVALRLSKYFGVSVNDIFELKN